MLKSQQRKFKRISATVSFYIIDVCIYFLLVEVILSETTYVK